MIKKGKATAISDHIAKALIRERHKRHLTQRAVAEILGISFQQYQKYEKAKDRISFERVTTLAESYRIPLAALYLEESEHQGFAETEQVAFGAKPSVSSLEKRMLDIFATVPPKQQEKFLEVMQVNAKVMQ